MGHRIRLRAPRLCMIAFATVLLAGKPAMGQRLFWDSVGVLPGTLTRVEYQNLKSLRNMPHFSSLRRTYTGTSTHDLEKWLAAFGLREEDVTEVVVGLEGDKTGRRIFAMAAGRFSPTLPTEANSPRTRFLPMNIGDLTAYCDGPPSEARYCGMFKAQNWAALGTREFLSYVANGGDGLSEPLSSESEFMDLVATIPRDAPLWGIAQGASAVQWLKAVVPFADSMPIVWSTVLDGIGWGTYSLTPEDDRMRIAVRLDYKTSAGASLFGVAIQGVKAIASVLWHKDHPGCANPFSDAEVAVDDRAVLLTLSAAYDVLESGLVLGSGGRP